MSQRTALCSDLQRTKEVKLCIGLFSSVSAMFDDVFFAPKNGNMRGIWAVLDFIILIPIWFFSLCSGHL